jgi:F-type H+-transporting ATPase subunit delta
VRASPAVARSYAKALFEIAKERGVAEPLGEELAQLAHLVVGTPGLAGFLSRPWVGVTVKRNAAIEIATRSNLTPLARDFFALVVAHGRVDHLEAIAAAYRGALDADAGRVRAHVRTAVAMSDDERKTLANRIGRELGGKQVVLDERVDSTLLGGFVAEVGSLVVDGSLDGQLARLRGRLARA